MIFRTLALQKATEEDDKFFLDDLIGGLLLAQVDAGEGHLGQNELGQLLGAPWRHVDDPPHVASDHTCIAVSFPLAG
jgi:hypothetical protein